MTRPSWLHTIVLVLFLLCCALPVLARSHWHYPITLGGQPVLTQGMSSSTKAPRSLPFASITIYKVGTTTKPAIYSTISGTVLANPFTSDQYGNTDFYCDESSVDIYVVAAGLSPFTIRDIGPTGTAFPLSLGVDIRSYGAVCDGTTDDTAAIQAALSVSGPHATYFPSGTCLVTDTLNITQNRVSVIGQGEQSTIIKFQPTSGGKSVFKLATGLTQVVISGFGFRSTDTTYQKIMVETLNCEEVEIVHIASAETQWTGNTSEGIRSEGRQFLHIHDVTIAADLPIHFMNNTAVSLIDADHYHLGPSLYLIANNNPNILVDPDVVLTNLSIDGFSWNKGTDGIVFQGTSVAASETVAIRNGRWEQQQGGAGWMFDFSGSNLINGFKLDAVYGGLGAKFIRLRNISFPTLTNCFYLGSSTALDVTNTVYALVLENFYSGLTAGGSTASLSGQTQISGDEANTLAVPVNAHYKSTDPASVNSRFSVVNDTNMRAFNGTLAAAGTVNLWSDFAGTENGVILIVSARNNTTGAPEGGIVLATGTASGSAFKASATTNFDTTAGAGKLSLAWGNSTNLVLTNALAGAATCTYSVLMLWK